MPSIFIDPRLANRTLLEVAQTVFRLPRAAALDALRARRIRICGGVCVDPQRRVKVGQHIQLDGKPAKSRTETVDRQIIVRYVDKHIVVVEKPAGLTTVRHAGEVESLGKRAKKFLPATLVDLLPAVLARTGTPAKGRIRAVHRIDKETSGLVVLARTGEAESNLGKQFRAHSVGRMYLALVRGKAKDARIESHLAEDRGDGRRGSATQGQHAITHVRVVETLGDFTLVECELETGRTHQVRIHLGEQGTPLCGERVYDRPLNGKPLPDASGAKRPLLHAAYLAIDHPDTGKRMAWNAKLPKDMSELIERLQNI
ncbi:MAG: RluA family pseudouridine synthase [Planctomycetes bacterium]|nr:RluA family pseudouridine synthase [Planctomycetota bacterium]